jgi:hypothetical protein
MALALALALTLALALALSSAWSTSRFAAWAPRRSQFVAGQRQ